MPPCNKQQTIELDSTTWTALNELALAIHASHGVDKLQKETLEGTTGLVPHRIAMFDLIEAAGSDAPRYVHPASSGMDDRALSDYYNRYAAMDYTTWSFDLHKVGVYRDLDLVDVERRDATPIYRKWMEPQGVYFGCTATLAHNDRPLGSITCFANAQPETSPTPSSQSCSKSLGTRASRSPTSILGALNSPRQKTQTS